MTIKLPVDVNTLDDETADLEKRLAEAERLSSAAINYINASPCDSDITDEQREAWAKYRKVLNDTRNYSGEI